MAKDASVIECIHSELYECIQEISCDGSLESYVSVLKNNNTYYITDTTHDDCDFDVQRNRIIIVSLSQLDALQRAIDVARKDMLMSEIQEASQKQGEAN